MKFTEGSGCPADVTVHFNAVIVTESQLCISLLARYNAYGMDCITHTHTHTD